MLSKRKMGVLIEIEIMGRALDFKVGLEIIKKEC